jgi:hypothetical protein
MYCLFHTPSYSHHYNSSVWRECKLWSSSLCSFLQSLVIASLFKSKFSLHPVPRHPTGCSSLAVRAPVSCPFHIIKLSFILAFSYFNPNAFRQDKRQEFLNRMATTFANLNCSLFMNIIFNYYSSSKLFYLCRIFEVFTNYPYDFVLSYGDQTWTWISLRLFLCIPPYQCLINLPYFYLRYLRIRPMN